MMRFSHQLIFGLLVFVLLSGLVIWLHLAYVDLMPHIRFLSGWVLLAVMLLLTLYNGRKKIPFLPLLRSETWLQFHIYAGMLTGVLFAVHITYKMPTGTFEQILAVLYVLVMLSGFFGLFISRAIPKRLTTRGGEVLFERIPAIRRDLEVQAEKLALGSVSESKSSTIGDFYVRELKLFFSGPQNCFSHWSENSSPVNHILTKISDVNRYLNEQERSTLGKIAMLVRQKDGLDYHYAHQLLLKGWLFTHIPLTYSLLIFTAVHVVLVFGFSGGVQ